MCIIVLSIDHPLGNGSGECVEDQSKEEGGEENNKGSNDVLLVVLPDEVEKALEGVHQP